jgi:hypothetical protein
MKPNWLVIQVRACGTVLAGQRYDSEAAARRSLEAAPFTQGAPWILVRSVAQQEADIKIVEHDRR